MITQFINLPIDVFLSLNISPFELLHNYFNTSKSMNHYLNHPQIWKIYFEKYFPLEYKQFAGADGDYKKAFIDASKNIVKS